jgi:NADH-quinone oxidoreductase subunit N
MALSIDGGTMLGAVRALGNVPSMLYFSPELVLCVGLLGVVLLDLIAPPSPALARRLFGTVLLFALGVAGAALWATVPSTPLPLFGGLLVRDGVGDLLKLLVLATAALTTVLAVRTGEPFADARGVPARDGAGRDHEVAEFFALVLATCVGLFLMVSASDLLSAYVGFELVSIMSYVLAGVRRGDPRSSEAALKYVIYGGVATGVLLYGLSLLYGMAGSTAFVAIANASVLHGGSWLLLTAVVLVVAGLGYKVAAVPFHMWCPDVYEGAPTSVTAFFSVAPKAAALGLLLRLFAQALVAGGGPWTLVLGVLAVATMTVGNLAALGQTNLKRLLAYSSIAQAGYLLLGVAVMGPQAQSAVLFYLVTYLAMNLGAFAVVNAVAQQAQAEGGAIGAGERLEDFRGLGYRAPWLAVPMALFLISLTGLPPTAGFIGKLYIFAAAVAPGTTALTVFAILGVLNSAVSLYYYARVLQAMFLRAPAAGAPSLAGAVDRGLQVVVVLLAVPTLLLGIYWSPVMDVVQRAVAGWGG